MTVPAYCLLGSRFELGRREPIPSPCVEYSNLSHSDTSVDHFYPSCPLGAIHVFDHELGRFAFLPVPNRPQEDPYCPVPAKVPNKNYDYSRMQEVEQSTLKGLSKRKIQRGRNDETTHDWKTYSDLDLPSSSRTCHISRHRSHLVYHHGNRDLHRHICRVHKLHGASLHHAENEELFPGQNCRVLDLKTKQFCSSRRNCGIWSNCLDEGPLQLAYSYIYHRLGLCWTLNVCACRESAF